jgi:hypothetical protein
MYPKAELLGEQESLGAAVLDGPYIERLGLRNQEVPGFAKPTTVELRFWKGKLWGVIVYFGANDGAQAQAYVAKVFGPTTSRDPDMPIWHGEKVTTTGNYKQSWYGYTDDAMSQEAGDWVRAVLKQTWTGETPEEKAERERRMAALTPKAGAAGTPSGSQAANPQQ